MHSLPKLILLSSVVLVLPLGFALAKAVPDVTATKAYEIKAECTKQFNSEQMNDPNVPCYAQVADSLNPKDTVGQYYDRNLTVSQEETGGGHVMMVQQLTEDTIRNTYNIPFLKSAVPNFSSPAESGTDAGETQGTD